LSREPVTADFIVSTSRLNKIIEHEPADLIAIAESGVTLKQFNQTLSENGQWLPLDPPDDGRATLGGVVATGLGGCQQFGYGRPRGSVIGMKVVLADGSLVKAGGRVVKNVAGYDLCKLFTGSFGSLGIITELNFKLRPRPERESTIVANGNARNLVRVGQKIIDARLFPVAVELLSSALANQLDVEAKPNESVLLVRFAGNEKAVAFQNNQAISLLAEAATPFELADDSTLWQKLQATPLAESLKLSWRASVLPNLLTGLIEELSLIYGNEFSTSLWQAGVGDGRLRMMDISQGESEEKLSQLTVAIEAKHGQQFVERSGGDSIESALNEGLALRIKQQLDPNGILAPIP
jgi:FAD/FMN-containing dehydrogenase